MTLPVHVPFYDDETPLSFASRLAAANGYSSLVSMLGFMGLTWRMVWEADPQSLQEIGRWCGQSMEPRLRYSGPLNRADKTRTFGQATLLPLNQQRLDNIRCCPACIVEDLSRSGREIGRPYIRAWWTIAEIENCPAHKRPLVLLPPAKKTESEDLARRILEHLPKLKEDASEHIAVATEFDQFILDRIKGEPTSSFLGQLETHVAIQLCIRLGSDLSLVKMHSDITARELGYDVARKGPGAIVEAMRTAYRAKTDKKHAGFMHGHFPALALWVALKLHKPQYAPVVDIVREAAAWCLPIGPGDSFLGGVPRRLHSLKSASMEFGISQARIRAITTKAGILEGVRSGRSKETFDAAVGEKLLRAVLRSVDPAEACRSLGTSKFQLRRLCETGILSNVAETLNYNRNRIRVERTKLNQLLNALQRRATQVERAEGLSTISDAARASSFDYCVLLQIILAGGLKNVVYVGANCNLGTVRLDPEELLAVKHSSKPESVDAVQRLSLAEGRRHRFLLPPKFRKLTVTDLTKMPDAAAEELFKRLRWPETDGEPYCPKCGSLRCYKKKNRVNGFVCTQTTCATEFTVVSGTAVHRGKLSFKQLLIALWFSVNAPEEKAALKLSREIGVQYQTAGALLVKLHDAWRWAETAQEGEASGPSHRRSLTIGPTGVAG